MASQRERGGQREGGGRHKYRKMGNTHDMCEGGRARDEADKQTLRLLLSQGMRK